VCEELLYSLNQLLSPLLGRWAGKPSRSEIFLCASMTVSAFSSLARSCSTSRSSSAILRDFAWSAFFLGPRFRGARPAKEPFSRCSRQLLDGRRKAPHAAVTRLFPPACRHRLPLGSGACTPLKRFAELAARPPRDSVFSYRHWIPLCLAIHHYVRSFCCPPLPPSTSNSGWKVSHLS
jgi:hypothetical protein